MRHGLLAALIIAGCTVSTAPGYDVDLSAAYPFEPPAFFEGMYQDMEACAGLRGDYDALRWFRLPTMFIPNTANAPITGMWQPPSSLYFPQAADTSSVKHEFLHHITGALDHPMPPFGVCAPMSTGTSIAWEAAGG